MHVIEHTSTRARRLFWREWYKLTGRTMQGIVPRPNIVLFRRQAE